MKINNHIPTLLVQTPPDETTVGFALSVGAGGWQDPSECPGNAHLVEHLLFEGSDKYPSGNAYRNTFEQNGGSCNASFSASVDETTSPAGRE